MKRYVDMVAGVLRELATGRGDQSSQLRWGVVGVAVCAVLLLIAGALYVIPIGERTYTADFRVSGGARPGDEVRVAGIPVGEVRSVELAGDHVEVRFGVDRTVHVGESASVEVKMLTPIGGHYLSLTPTGEKPLGDRHIPPERTTVPFELSDILDHATPVMGKIDAQTLRATMAELNTALTDQPDALRGVIGNAAELTDVLADRSRQLDTALQVSDEYIAAIAADKAMLAGFVQQLGTVADQLGNRKEQIVRVFGLINRLFLILHRPLMAYGDTLEPPITEIEQIFSKVMADPSRIDTVVAGIRDVVDKLSAMLGIQVAVDRPENGVRVCVPYEGKAC
ncbi:MCE family protein [Nocardia sp. CC227C]|uniref:MCE family protein n=1 Tax=Nocardia sp. CC227C TaxID=3044562 RepID=UPI00278BE1AC|nr:MCE family protein [Nocardia sp. CC227C]